MSEEPNNHVVSSPEDRRNRVRAALDAPMEAVCRLAMGEDGHAAQSSDNAHPRTEVLRQRAYELARLDQAEFELIREFEAKGLGMKAADLGRVVSAARRELKSQRLAPVPEPPRLFEETKPYADPVDLAQLLDEMLGRFRRHVVCDKPYLVTAVLWCATTWVMEHLHVAAFALVTAPTMAAGKSVMLETMSLVSKRSFLAASVTEAVLMRLVDEHAVTLFFDESDRQMTEEKQGLIGVLNASYTRRTAKTARCVGDEHEVQQFSTWCGKAFAGIGHLESTMLSRAVRIELRRRLPHEPIESVRKPDRTRDAAFALIRRKAARWANDVDPDVFTRTPAVPDGLENRNEELWWALFQIADAAGGVWPELAREAALHALKSQIVPMSTSEEILVDIESVFSERRQEALPAKDIISGLEAMPERPWATYNRGQKITANQLAKWMRAFGIQPRQTRTLGGQNLRCYHFVDFGDALSRYGGPDAAAVAAPLRPSECSSTIAATNPNGSTENASNNRAIAPVAAVAAPQEGCRQISLEGGIGDGLRRQGRCP